MNKCKHPITWIKSSNKEPIIGDITTDTELSVKRSKQPVKYIYQACLKCNKPRWVQLFHRKNKPICKICHLDKLAEIGKNNSKEKNNFWNGGKSLSNGYILIRIYKDDPFYCMKSTGEYVPEHRLVLARHLGRPLKKEEQVHHLNGNKQDNRLENLVILKPHEHTWVTRLLQRIKELELQVEELKNGK